MIRRALTALLCLALAAAPGAAHHDDIPDPPPVSSDAPLPDGLDLDPDTVTVSGLSSGGYFAHQFHVAFSDLVTGAGILAGGPYACTEIIRNPFLPWLHLDPISAAVLACTNFSGSVYWGLRLLPPRAEDSLGKIEMAYRAGDIDDPGNLADDRVWLFRGTLDDIVPEDVGESLARLYRLLGADGATLKIESGDPSRPANHGLPVQTFPEDSRFDPVGCDEHAPPFIIECGFDAAGRMLRHLYPDGFPAEPTDAHAAGSLLAFDQSAFFGSAAAISLSDVGYLYVPDICRTERCRLHVAFHGCRQYADNQGSNRIHDDFVRDGGYNGWAAAAGIVVLYPQTTETGSNPMGCWDFWGYSGPGWRTRDGEQMRAVKAMVDALLGD